MIVVMKNKYKVVNVYSGYGENDICGVDVVEGKSLKDVCIKLLEEKKLKVKGDDSYFEEFVNMWGVKDGVGYVGDGEEGFDMVIDEKSKWWELVGKDDWSDEVSEEWDKLCDVDGYEVESKI
jgi:hypothetical protein